MQGDVRELPIYSNNGQRLGLELMWGHWTFSAHPQNLTLKCLASHHTRLQTVLPAPGGGEKDW